MLLPRYAHWYMSGATGAANVAAVSVPQGDNCTVEKTNAELYLKVIGQVMTMYKIDTQGMLFTQDDTSAPSTST